MGIDPELIQLDIQVKKKICVEIHRDFQTRFIMQKRDLFPCPLVVFGALFDERKWLDVRHDI